MAFMAHIGERLDLYKGLTPKEMNQLIADVTENKSDAYRLRFSRGLSLGANLPIRLYQPSSRFIRLDDL